MERQGLTIASSAFKQGALQCGEERDWTGEDGIGSERSGLERMGWEGIGLDWTGSEGSG